MKTAFNKAYHNLPTLKKSIKASFRTYNSGIGSLSFDNINDLLQQLHL